MFKFANATVYFILNVTGDLPDLQAPPHPSFIKNKKDSDNIEIDNNNNNNNKNNVSNKVIIIIMIMKITFFKTFIIYSVY